MTFAASTSAEPEDVQTLLIDDIPQAEINALDDQLGIATDNLFQTERYRYHVFVESIDRKATIIGHAGSQSNSTRSSTHVTTLTT